MINTLGNPCKPIPAPLPAAWQQRLDDDGYAVLPGILPATTVVALRERLAGLLEEEGSQAGSEVHQEAGTARLANLLDKGACFDLCLDQPQVLACVDHVLDGYWKLSSLNYRAAMPGSGHQALHVDWHGPVATGAWQVCNTVWLLDDFGIANGATRVVPGSHRWNRLPAQAMPDPSARHPAEIVLEAPAGAVVVFNSHLWHGGTRNRTDRPRRALFAYFTRRDRAQQTDQRRTLSPATIARLDPSKRWVVDV